MLRDEVLEEDTDWNIDGGDDPMEDFGITPPRGERQEAAAWKRRHGREELYMESARRGVLCGAYVEEPQRSRMDIEEEMDVAAVETHGGRRWEPWSSSQLAFIVSKAADAALSEDLKDIRPPVYDGNTLNLDRFLEKLDDWGMTVIEDMDPAEAKKYVFTRFRWRLPEVLQELYFVATKKGKIETLKEAKKWLNEQERVDAPQVAAKRWWVIKLQHDGRGNSLRDWPDFRGQYVLFRRNVEDCNRDAGSNSHEFARIRIRPEFARIRGPLRTRFRNFKFESSVIRLIESIGTYNLPSRLQFTCLHMGMPLPSTISHKRFPKSFRNLAIFVVCCCLHLPC